MERKLLKKYFSNTRKKLANYVLILQFEIVNYDKTLTQKIFISNTRNN